MSKASKPPILVTNPILVIHTLAGCGLLGSGDSGCFKLGKGELNPSARDATVGVCGVHGSVELCSLDPYRWVASFVLD